MDDVDGRWISITVSVKEGSLSVTDEQFKSFILMRWVKDYRNRVKDKARSSTAQGFVRDVIFVVRGVTK